MKDEDIGNDFIVDIHPIIIDSSPIKSTHFMKPTSNTKPTLLVKPSPYIMEISFELIGVRRKVAIPSAFKPLGVFKIASNKPCIGDLISCILVNLVHSLSVRNIDHLLTLLYYNR